MPYEQKDNTFDLFKNKVEEGSRKPNFSGQGLYKGELVDIAGWFKTRKDGSLIKDKNGNAIIGCAIRPASEREKYNPGKGANSSPKREDPADFFR